MSDSAKNLFEFMRNYLKLDDIRTLCFKLGIIEGDVIGNDTILTTAIIRLLQKVKEKSKDDFLYSALLELRFAREEELKVAFAHYQDMGRLSYAMLHEDIPKPKYQLHISLLNQKNEKEYLFEESLIQVPEKGSYIWLNVNGEDKRFYVQSVEQDGTGRYDARLTVGKKTVQTFSQNIFG